MTRDLGVAVAPAVDLAALESRWLVLDEKEARTLGEIRLERGRLLIDARKAFPASGPKAAGWGDLLRRWKIEETTARHYMRLAGAVDPEIPALGAEIPTYAKAGITRAVLPSHRDRSVGSANLPTPRTSAPAPTVHREATRTIRGDSQVAPEDGDPVFVRDENLIGEGENDENLTRVASSGRGAHMPPRQLAFDWAGTAAAVKREVARAGVDEAAALVSEMCERVPGLRRVLLAQLGGGAA